MFWRSQTDGRQNHIYNGKIKLTLNPIRAFVHNTRRRQINVSEPRISLRTRTLSNQMNERPINPLDDNVVCTPRHQALLARIDFASFTERYIREVNDFCRGLLLEAQRATQDVDQAVNIEITNRVNVKQIETAFDLPTRDPINTVHQLAPRFQARGRDSRHRNYSNVVADVDVNGNIPIISTRLAAGKIAKLYAKTNRKVRLEVQHNLNAVSNIGPHTFDGENMLSNIFDLLRRCREDATARSEALIGGLNELEDETIDHRPPYELVLEILSSTQSDRDKQLLLSILINQISYTHRMGDTLQSAIRRLQRRNVVRSTSPRSRIYELTPQYEQARVILAAQAPVRSPVV